jgi:hypothetical protein
MQKEEHPGSDEEEDRNGRAQPAQDEPQASHTSLNRIIPSGIGS